MRLDVKISNVERWKRRHQSLPRLIREELDKAAETNAEFFVREAKRQVEVDTGELEGAIRYYRAQGYDGGVWRAVAGINKGKGFYARFREFGTVTAQSNPFFFTTYRAMLRSFRARNTRALKKASKRAAT